MGCTGIAGGLRVGQPRQILTSGFQSSFEKPPPTGQLAGALFLGCSVGRNGEVDDVQNPIVHADIGVNNF